MEFVFIVGAVQAFFLTFLGINKITIEIEKINLRKVNLENSFLDGLISPEDFRSIKKRIDEELIDLVDTLRELKSHKSPFKVYLNKTLPLIENLSGYWDKADGKTKKKILGCIFYEKLENLNLRVATTHSLRTLSLYSRPARF